MKEKYFYLIIPLIVAVIIQLIKIIIQISKGKFSWKNLIDYGGMPSGHTALVVSITTLIFFNYGLANVFFAVSFILTILIIRDALGFRRYLADHSKAINELIKDLPDELEYKYKIQEERIGHTAGEVLGGAVISIILTYLLYYYFFN